MARETETLVVRPDSFDGRFQPDKWLARLGEALEHAWTTGDAPSAPNRTRCAVSALFPLHRIQGTPELTTIPHAARADKEVDCKRRISIGTSGGIP
jgi:hypothetical protein